MQTFESREGVQRHPKPPLVTTPAPGVSAAQPASVTGRAIQRSRVGKVSIGLWVDPAVRKQIARLALDLDKDRPT